MIKHYKVADTPLSLTDFVDSLETPDQAVVNIIPTKWRGSSTPANDISNQTNTMNVIAAIVIVKTKGNGN